MYSSVLLVVLLFGAIRSDYNALQKKKMVKVAGVSAPIFGFMETMYKDYCGKDIILPPKSSITSGVLQKVNKSLAPFIETADTVGFKNGFASLNRINDSLFILSQIAADRGAKIICWSEANGMTFPAGAPALIARGKAFAARNKVYLQMAIAIMHPGKITPGRKFLENEAILIGPDGQILNIFHKNNPVPMAEASEPGDGIVPAVASPYGNISTSICYDADFPAHRRQMGKKKTGVLLLPSGDWYAIDPYHSYMAIFRGVENGCSVVRQVSGGLSLASDYRGQIKASMDFYTTPLKLWVADIPVGHVFTVYSVIGDSFAFICMIVTVLCLVYRLVLLVRGKARKAVKQPAIRLGESVA